MQRLSTLMLGWFLFVGGASVPQTHEIKAPTALERQRPSSEEPSRLFPIPVELLHKLVSVHQLSDGTFELNVRTDTAATDARIELSKIAEDIRLGDLIEAFEAPLLFKVLDQKSRTLKEIEVPLQGAIVAMALSQASRDRFGGRRLFLSKGKNQVVTTAPVPTLPISSKSLRVNLGETAKFDEGRAAKWKFSFDLQADEPAPFSLNYSGEEKAYVLEENPDHAVWRARPQLKEVLTLVPVKEALKKMGEKALPGTTTDQAAEQVLAQEEVSEVTEGKPELKPLLKRSFGKYISRAWNARPLTVSRTPVSGGQSLLHVLPATGPRVAFCQNKGNNSMRRNCSTAAGAVQVHFTSGIGNATAQIQQAYEAAGQPVEIILASHGCGGRMDIAEPGWPQLQTLMASTKGMVSGVYAMGCSVGKDAGSSRHLLNVLAQGWGVPAHGVDRMLQMKGSGKWYVSGSGNLVTVQPTATPEVNPEELVENTPVWKMPL